MMEKVAVTLQLPKDVADYFQRLPVEQKLQIEESLEENTRRKMKMEEKRAKLKADIYASFGFDEETIEEIEHRLKTETMEDLLNRMHQQSEANGMTEEIFNELMRDEE